MQDKRIVITGLTGQVGKPVALALARSNEVIGAARYSNPKIRQELSAAGVQCVEVDLASGDVSALPRDVDHVLNFAVARSGDWQADMAANVTGLGALMSHCRAATSMLHCSSTAVYAPASDHVPRCETDRLADNNHRNMFATYVPTKLAAEEMARFGAREWDLPTTIARLNVPYGNNGGWPYFHLEMLLAGMPIPVHTDAPSTYNVIHEDDIIAQIPALLAAASVPATVVNWCGHETVSIEEWVAFLGELAGKEATTVASPDTIEPVPTDPTLLHQLAGPTTVTWREGFRRMAEHFHPELFA